jgi:hypothetical protein
MEPCNGFVPLAPTPAWPLEKGFRRNPPNGAGRSGWITCCHPGPVDEFTWLWIISAPTRKHFVNFRPESAGGFEFIGRPPIRLGSTWWNRILQRFNGQLGIIPISDLLTKLNDPFTGQPII